MTFHKIKMIIMFLKIKKKQSLIKMYNIKRKILHKKMKMILKNQSKGKSPEFKHSQQKRVKKELNRKTLKLERKNLKHRLRRKSVAEILIKESFKIEQNNC